MQAVTEIIGEYLTVRQSSKVLDIGEGAVRQHFDKGNLAGMRGPGGDRLISAASVRRFKRQREIQKVRRER